MKPTNETPFSDANAKASQAGVITNDVPQTRPTQRAAMDVRVGNDSLPLHKDGTVSLDAILGPSKFAVKR
jgi:hypothetical protein